jgi:hypothetical protein
MLTTHRFASIGESNRAAFDDILTGGLAEARRFALRRAGGKWSPRVERNAAKLLAATRRAEKSGVKLHVATVAVDRGAMVLTSEEIHEIDPIVPIQPGRKLLYCLEFFTDWFYAPIIDVR